MTDRIRAALTRVATELGVPDAEFVLERPRDNGHGDLATNLAMVLARPLRTNPRQLAERVVDSLALPVGVIERTEPD